MKKAKKILLTVGAYLLTAALAIGGTVAYLTWNDSDVNVMTLGNVKIEQIEQQYDENGELVDFKQGKPLYPYVGKFGWKNTDEANGAYRQFTMNNVVDKYVSVKNTGKSDAYVRTLIAFEMGDFTYEEFTKIGISNNLENGSEFKFPGTWNVADDFVAEINGQNYNIVEFVHTNPVKSGETTIPSLLQVYLSKEADNEDVEKLDGNKNSTYDILALSQAVQTAGFSDAKTALDTAFGKSAENAAQWFSGLRPEFEVEGNNKAAIVDAINEAMPGSAVVLTEDVTIAGYNATNKLTIDKDVVLDLNGHTITTECGWGGIDLKGGASIINGTINHTGNTAAIKAFNVDKIENVTINVTETAGKTKGGIVVQNNAGNSIGSIKNVTINGATNGIECYFSTNDPAIGTMENVKINATANGIYLNGAGKIGKISNCEIKGGNIGINAYLANLWHISLDIENSKIIGGTTGLDMWDEAKPNTGSTATLNYDAASSFVGARENIKVTLQEEITCTVNGAAQTTPCDIRIK